VGDCYCTVIDGCHELFDVRRCETWTDSFSKWCDSQPDLVLYRGHCLLHRAEILLLRGAWSDAILEATQAAERLAEPVHPLTLGGAHYVEAELRRLRGEFKDAERAFQDANEMGCEPQPGLALLRLAQGWLDAADASIRRVHAQTEGTVARARILAPYSEIVLAGGDIEAARLAADELAGIAFELTSPFLRAQAAYASGAVCLAEDNPTAAVVALRRAWKGWVELDAPYEAARTRVLLAAACRALGDHDGEALELAAARATFEALRARSELDRLRDLASAPERDAPGGLTGRELEILALVARGKSNRTIAEHLYISEKTVASHVSHILTKLGLPSRAAATAYAYEHSLV
jgi:DNA-binding NarL/FixJ family response regulator